MDVSVKEKEKKSVIDQYGCMRESHYSREWELGMEPGIEHKFGGEKFITGEDKRRKTTWVGPTHVVCVAADRASSCSRNS